MATAQARKPANGTPDAGNGGGNLRMRVAAGLAMALVALALTYWGVVPFTGLVVLIGLLMTWEWGQMVRTAGILDPTGVVHAVTIVIVTVLTVCGYPVMALVGIAVGTILTVLMRFGHGAGLAGAGVLYVGLPAIALVWLRSDAPYGFLAIVYLFVTVWAADTGAFASGRLLGGPRLWPSVSPNKTWAGLLGGMAAAAAAGALFAAAIANAGAPVSVARLALTGLALGAVALAGDLAESALKRSFGVKDSSGLIPGHGGVLDRMDSMVAVAIMAALVAIIANGQAPARALLFGS